MLEIKTVTNGPIAIQPRRVCHDTLPWLISISLDVWFVLLADVIIDLLKELLGQPVAAQ